MITIDLSLRSTGYCVWEGRELLSYGIINTRFFINVAKLGFETYLVNERLPAEFDPLLIIRVDFPKNKLFIYQIPISWDPPEVPFRVIKSMEFGHSLASFTKLKGD